MSDGPELGTLVRIDPREAWKSEPYDFTPWLRENIHLLGQALGLEIDAEVHQEVAVGLFSADLLGTDVSTNRRILIENQLSPTDHTHLGQILTYASGLDAGILVWLATQVRDEHAQALTWLNERTGDNVLAFAVEIELLRIGDSPLAPHFKVVVAPNEWQKTTSGTGTKGNAGGKSAVLYRAFWQRFITDLTERSPGATAANPDLPPSANWFGIPLGRTGCTANLAFGWDNTGILRAEVYLDTGDKDLNEALFDYLEADKNAIEAEIGESLTWSRRDDIRASRIYASRPGTIHEPTTTVDEFRVWGIDLLLKIKDVFAPRLAVFVPGSV